MRSLPRRILRRVWCMTLMLLPSRLKIEILRLRGHQVSRRAQIGMSWLNIDHISLGDGARIGLLNFFKGLQSLEMGPESEIVRFNVFTAYGPFADIGGAEYGRVTLRRRAAITMRHYFDCQSSVTIGEDSVIGGIGTVFFTHQKGVRTLNEAKPIRIGPRVYLGAACVVLPGAVIRGRAYIGGGSIVSGMLEEQDVIYASPRATVVKLLPEDAAYFASHHPTGHLDEPDE
jgi:acetyltransferase-like isoleucine patch superfamily enzyme